MEPWTRMGFQPIVLAVAAWSVTRAGGDDSWNELKTKDWPPPRPPGFIAGIVFMVVLFVVAFFAILLCFLRRRRMLMAQQTFVPAFLVPVTAGVPMYPDQQPHVSGAMTSPAAPYPPQQHGYQPQATPYTQAPLYAAQNIDYLPHPSGPAPRDAPPPYNYETTYKQ